VAGVKREGFNEKACQAPPAHGLLMTPRWSKPDSNPPSRLRACAPYSVPNQAEPDWVFLEHLP